MNPNQQLSVIPEEDESNLGTSVYPTPFKNHDGRSSINSLSRYSQNVRPSNSNPNMQGLEFSLSEASMAEIPTEGVRSMASRPVLRPRFGQFGNGDNLDEFASSDFDGNVRIPALPSPNRPRVSNPAIAMNRARVERLRSLLRQINELPLPETNALNRRMRIPGLRFRGRMMNRQLLARRRDFLWGHSSMESGFRGYLRILANFIFLVMIFVQLFKLRADLTEYKNLSDYSKVVIKSEDNEVMYGKLFRKAALVYLVEHIASAFEFFRFKKMKKKVFTINYTHTIAKICFFGGSYMLIKDSNKLLWILTSADFLIQIIHFVIFVTKHTQNHNSYLNINILCFWIRSPIQLLVSLKIFGIIHSWAAAMIPCYLFSTIVFIFGIISFLLKRKAYNDFYGKFNFNFF
jgi:hypothetical protein